MRPVSQVDPSTTIIGFKSSIPVFVSGAALARLGHPLGKCKVAMNRMPLQHININFCTSSLGEANITRGAGRSGIIQMVSSNASLSYAQIAEARISPDQPLFFQLYKHKDDHIAEKRVREVIQLGYNAIFLTVDAICAGNRERDIRAPFELEELEREAGEGADKGEGSPDGPAKQQKDESGNVNLLGTAGSLIANDDMDMTWEKTIPWLRSVTKLPIVIKGIQCVEVSLEGARMSTR